jgi:hypothetical protein
MNDEQLQQNEPVETEIDAEENPIEGQEQEVSDGEGEEVDDSLTVEIGEPDEEPEHITELRRRYREQQKRLKELEAQSVTPANAPQLPPKPTLEDCDYDAEAFEKKLEGWYEQKREHDAREAEIKAVQERANQRWEQKLTRYEEGKSKLGAPDYDDAETTVSQIFDKPFPGLNAPDVRMGIIKQGAKDPNALIYALGKNQAKAKELAEIEDPVEFAFALGELSAKMKIVRGKAPPPEKKVSGAVPGVAGAMDNTLERLRDEAARTGDFSKVRAYKAQIRA